MNNENEWWFPVICDEEWIESIMSDYPEDTENMSFGEIHDKYNSCRKYSVTWDHAGDAYEEYEKLADAYLLLLDNKQG